MGKKVLLLFVLLLFFGCASVQGPWKGKVIDAKTKEPIDGAVVVAIWDEFHAALGSGFTDFYDAKETLTDKNGEFKIPLFIGFSIPLIDGIGAPMFRIFKPGYGYQTVPQWPKQKFIPVELSELKEKIERQENLDEIKSLDVDAPEKKTPLLNKLINAEEKNIETIKLEETKKYGLSEPPLVVTKKRAEDGEENVAIKPGQGLMLELHLGAAMDLELKSYDNKQLKLLGTYKSPHSFVWQWVFIGEKPGTSIIDFQEKSDRYYPYFKINVKII